MTTNSDVSEVRITEILRDLWQEVLGASSIDEPDFIRAGGSSLVLMEIQFALKKQTGVLIDLDSIPFPLTFDGIAARAMAGSSIVKSESTRPEIDTFPATVDVRYAPHEGHSRLIGPSASVPATLPSMVRAAATRTPEAIAVRDGEEAITYAELVASADQLAREIRRIDPTAEGRIAIIRIDPGIDYCIAVLAAITARSFAAPIHPELPALRVNKIIAEAQPIVTLGGPEDAGASVLPVRRLSGDRIATDGSETPATSVDDPCYALFTSGSTGVPKGVLMHQLPVANLARFESMRVEESTSARTAQMAPLGFDVAFQEMFGTWAAGGELLVVPLGVRKDPAKLVCFLQEHRVTRFYCVPLLLRMIARASNLLETPLLDLQEIVTSGERLRIDETIRAFGRACPQLRIVNQLGAAETIQTTSIDLGSETNGWPEYPELGPPIPGVQLRVTSSSGETLPRGEEGEIEIGGFGPALGYLGDRETDRFIQDESGRWYRTGDRGEIDIDGRLVYRGRRDHQVKVRGFRIELGDVERTMAGIDFIEDVVVVAVDGGSGGLELQAMLTTNADQDEITISEALADSLPPWMIPQRIRIVQELPSTSSGKIDRVTVARTLAASSR